MTVSHVDVNRVVKLIEFNSSIKAEIVAAWSNPTSENSQRCAELLFSIPAVQHIIKGMSKADLDTLLREAVKRVVK